MRCQCISPDCVSELHEDLECKVKAKRQVRSLDFLGDVIWMCRMCAADAVDSGIFEDVKRAADN